MRWLSCLLLAPLLASAEPLSLTHQTRIVGPLGNPIEGEHSVELSFWTVDAGGTEANDQLWVATFPAVMLNEGYASSCPTVAMPSTAAGSTAMCGCRSRSTTHRCCRGPR